MRFGTQWVIEQADVQGNKALDRDELKTAITVRVMHFTHDGIILGRSIAVDFLLISVDFFSEKQRCPARYTFHSDMVWLCGSPPSKIVMLVLRSKKGARGFRTMIVTASARQAQVLRRILSFDHASPG